MAAVEHTRADRLANEELNISRKLSLIDVRLRRALQQVFDTAEPWCHEAPHGVREEPLQISTRFVALLQLCRLCSETVSLEKQRFAESLHNSHNGASSTADPRSVAEGMDVRRVARRKLQVMEEELRVRETTLLEREALTLFGGQIDTQHYLSEENLRQVPHVTVGDSTDLSSGGSQSESSSAISRHEARDRHGKPLFQWYTGLSTSGQHASILTQGIPTTVAINAAAIRSAAANLALQREALEVHCRSYFSDLNDHLIANPGSSRDKFDRQRPSRGVPDYDVQLRELSAAVETAEVDLSRARQDARNHNIVQDAQCAFTESIFANRTSDFNTGCADHICLARAPLKVSSRFIRRWQRQIASDAVPDDSALQVAGSEVSSSPELDSVTLYTATPSEGSSVCSEDEVEQRRRWLSKARTLGHQVN